MKSRCEKSNQIRWCRIKRKVYSFCKKNTIIPRIYSFNALYFENSFDFVMEKAGKPNKSKMKCIIFELDIVFIICRSQCRYHMHVDMGEMKHRNKCWIIEKWQMQCKTTGK